MRKNLTKQERLRKKSDINRVFRDGRVVSSRGAKLRFFSNELQINRVVFIPARKFGNAVKRNLLKRHAREVYRQEKERLRYGVDIAVVFYPGKEYDFWERKDQIMHLFFKAGLLVKTNPAHD